MYCHAKFEHGEINRYEDEGDDDTNYKNKDWFQCVVQLFNLVIKFFGQVL